MNYTTRAFFGASLAAALAMASPFASAQQEQGRVISSSPMRTSDGNTSYSVTYEYAGRQYTTRTDSPPGQHIPLQVSPMGVAVTQPVADQPQFADNSQQSWQNVVPEPGVVVSGGAAAPVVYAPPPVYGAPAYPYPYPAPVYVAPGYGYGYGGYGYGYGGPPIGVSLNLGYSSYHGGGWGGGYHRGWR